MLKILQARVQQYVNRELPDVKDGFRKGRGTEQTFLQKHTNSQKVHKRRSTSLIIKKMQIKTTGHHLTPI